MMASSSNLNQASIQWANRPDDERYLTLAALHRAVSSRRSRSDEFNASARAVGAAVTATDDRLLIAGRDHQEAVSEPTYWAFGQLCAIAQVPADYLRRLGNQGASPIAALNLAWALTHTDRPLKALVETPLSGAAGVGKLRAFTSETYGRIWDSQVTQALLDLDDQTAGQWKVPAASYTGADPLRATTLYAADHNMFAFLVDPDRPIEPTPGDIYFRGFIVWNSEVGDTTFGLRTFLYRYVCDNRIVWGAEDVTELRIRHTKGGPDRFAWEAAPALKEYAESSAGAVEERLRAARAYRIPQLEPGKAKESVTDFLQKRGFGKEFSQVAFTLAEEEGDPTSLYNVIQGVTAAARRINHTDARLDLEVKAGALLGEGKGQ